jgi:hypothetical protein
MTQGGDLTTLGEFTGASETLTSLRIDLVPFNWAIEKVRFWG